MYKRRIGEAVIILKGVPSKRNQVGVVVEVIESFDHCVHKVAYPVTGSDVPDLAWCFWEETIPAFETPILTAAQRNNL